MLLIDMRSHRWNQAIPEIRISKCMQLPRLARCSGSTPSMHFRGKGRHRTNVNTRTPNLECPRADRAHCPCRVGYVLSISVVWPLCATMLYPSAVPDVVPCDNGARTLLAKLRVQRQRRARAVQPATPIPADCCGGPVIKRSSNLVRAAHEAAIFLASASCACEVVEVHVFIQQVWR